MADYYPLIARAVAGLEKNTGEARRTLYERARTALVDQLRGATPALGESDITRERLALEEAIRKVEAEAARRMRFDPPKSEAPSATRSPDSARRKESPRSVPLSARTASPITDAIRNEGNAQRNANHEGNRDTKREGNNRERSGNDRPSVSDEGLKGFRDVVAEAERLGTATALASRAARQKFAAVPSPSPEFDRMEPRVEPEGLRPTGRNGQPQLLEPDAGFDDARPSRSRQRSAEDEIAVEHPPLTSYKGLITMTVAGVVVVALLLTGYWQRQAISGMVQSVVLLFKSEPAPSPRDNTKGVTKIPDRILPGSQPQQQTAPASRPSGQMAPSSGATVQVAQKVVLYEEDASDSTGKQFVGSAIWRTETVAPAPGQTPELAVRADIEIPDRHLTVQWSLRRNTDQALPASHTVEIIFTVPADFPHGGINNVPGLLMKQTEQTRGVPLAGLAVKVTTGFFLLGLSAVETDMQRNVQLLKERAWFDIPIVYADGKRAILAVEKGNPGQQAFNDAFSTWAKR